MTDKPDVRYYGHIREHPEISASDVRLLKRYLPNDARVLDIGSGRADFVIACRGTFHAVALDLEQEAARFWREQPLEGVLANGLCAPFRDSSLEAVRAMNVIEHFANPLPLVEEAARILKPGGLLLLHGPSQFSILYPITNFYDDYTHYSPLTRAGMRRLLEDGGFQVLLLHGYTAGRNPVERVLNWLLARVIPWSWRALGRKL